MVLNDLISEFRVQIRDNGTTQALTDAEVTQFITDGLRTYSKYRPRKRPTTVNVVSGLSAYTLPTDWMDVEYTSWNRAIQPQPVVDPMRLMPFTLLAETELIARPMAYQAESVYDFYVDDAPQLVINPTPQTSYGLNFDYYAYHTADSTVCTVPYMDLNNALLPGIVKGLRSIATDYSVKLQTYKMGNNIQVDDRTVATNLQNRANELDKQFERDVIKRPVAIMG